MCGQKSSVTKITMVGVWRFGQMDKRFPRGPEADARDGTKIMLGGASVCGWMDGRQR